MCCRDVRTRVLAHAGGFAKCTLKALAANIRRCAGRCFYFAAWLDVHALVWECRNLAGRFDRAVKVNVGKAGWNSVLPGRSDVPCVECCT